MLMKVNINNKRKKEKKKKLFEKVMKINIFSDIQNSDLIIIFKHFQTGTLIKPKKKKYHVIIIFCMNYQNLLSINFWIVTKN